MVRLTAAVLAGLAVLLIGATVAQASPRPPESLMHVLLRVGRDGSINSGEKQGLRQRGFDKIAIAQVMAQARDGGRLTRPEADKIIKAFSVRANKIDPMIAICKQSPDYPARKNR